MENPCECGIETPGSISHGVNYSITTELRMVRVLCRNKKGKCNL